MMSSYNKNDTMPYDDDYVPIISKEYYQRTLRRIFSYAIKKDMRVVIHTILHLEPDLKTSMTDSECLACLLGFLLRDGPLPDITKHKYMYTLYTAVFNYLRNHKLTNILEAKSLVKMEAGLRFLLVRSLIYSQGNIRQVDMEAAVKKYFSDDDNHVNSIIGSKADAYLIQDYKRANYRARDYFAARIQGIHIKTEDHTKNILDVYEQVGQGGSPCSIKEALTTILAEIRRSADDTLLIFDESSDTTASIEAASVYLSAPSQSPDMSRQEVGGSDRRANEYVRHQLGDRSEHRLVDSVHLLHDLSTQSQFFLNLQHF
eukprot:TRINITY_DN5565_c0_g1_i1.p1 TRINITY_DN5565_c0_g1~~TRINITY_DN5565_c0_g1_i1.p1  ORF type:complete len:316 (-),score=78.28 TRINITY_DN5565_c0_g1_i1:472-1419(-)